MNDKIKALAQLTVDKIHRKVKRTYEHEFYKFGTNVGLGADGTLTKYIDKIAEEAALTFIKKSKIKVNVLSEEAGFVDFGGKYTFVLDPLDGTRNAYRGIPFYAVSLGIGKNTLYDVEFGIVKNISNGDMFIAEKGHGAYLNNKSFAIPDVPPKEIVSALTLGKNCDPLTLTLAEKDLVRSLGAASLEMCLVAIGALDFYIVGREYLRVTDIAASTLIVREAGGTVTNIDGEEIDLPLSLDERTSVITAGSKNIVEYIIAQGKT